MIRLSVDTTLVEGRVAWSNANHAWGERHAMLVRLSDADGCWGQGEAAPLAKVSIETFAQVQAAIAEYEQAGLSVDEGATVFEVWDGLEAGPASVQCALQTATGDWMARRAGVPFHRLLTDTPPTSVDIAATVVSESGQWRAQTDDYINKGYRTIKFKVGRDLLKELNVLGAIRGAHPDVAIRIDANRSLERATVESHAQTIEQIDLAYFEEPSHEAVTLPCALALDESLIAMTDAEVKEALSGSVTTLVLKPMVLGVARCVALARLARDSGCSVSLSHALDGPIARALALELSLAFENSVAAGLDAHPGLRVWPDVQTAALQGIVARPHSEVGLGISDMKARCDTA